MPNLKRPPPNWKWVNILNTFTRYKYSTLWMIYKIRRNRAISSTVSLWKTKSEIKLGRHLLIHCAKIWKINTILNRRIGARRCNHSSIFLSYRRLGTRRCNCFSISLSYRRLGARRCSSSSISLSCRRLGARQCTILPYFSLAGG